jgi:hypothetical protein
MRISTMVFPALALLVSAAMADTCPRLSGRFACEEAGSAAAPREISFHTHHSEDFVVYYISSASENLGLRADGMEYPMSDDERMKYFASCEGKDTMSFVINDVSDAEMRVQRERSVIRSTAGKIEMTETFRAANKSEKLKDISYTRWICRALR